MKTKTNTGNSYTFGEVVRLGAGSGSERFKKDGWSDTEKEFTWTTGYSAKLAFLIPPASGAVIPAGLVKDGGLLTLELQTPNPASPKSLGIGDDSRVLGVLCSEMAIRAGP
jgi:hypothetical protein